MASANGKATSSGEMTFAVASEKRLKFVPNWNGITMPDTTPIPKATEKIRVQKFEMRAYTSRPVKKLMPSTWA